MALPPGLRAAEGQGLMLPPSDPLPTPRPPVTSTYPVLSPADKVDNASALETGANVFIKANINFH